MSMIVATHNLPNADAFTPVCQACWDNGIYVLPVQGNNLCINVCYNADRLDASQIIGTAITATRPVDPKTVPPTVPELPETPAVNPPA